MQLNPYDPGVGGNTGGGNITNPSEFSPPTGALPFGSAQLNLGFGSNYQLQNPYSGGTSSPPPAAPTNNNGQAPNFPSGFSGQQGAPTNNQSSSAPSTPPPAANLPGPLGGGARPASWASDYDPSKGGFQWRDGTLHGSPEGASGSPTLPDGKPNPNYFAGGPTADVFGNTLGSNNWGKAMNTLAAPSGAARSPFGPNPFMTNAGWTAPGGFSGGYNGLYFPTRETAQQVAAMIPGARLVSGNAITNAPGSPIQQNQPNYMIQLPDGRVINPGHIVDAYSHGYSQNYVNQIIARELNGGQSLSSLDPVIGNLAVQNGKVSQMMSPDANGNMSPYIGPTTSFTQPYAPQDPSGNYNAFNQYVGGGSNPSQTPAQFPGVSPSASATLSSPTTQGQAASQPLNTVGNDFLSQILQLYTGVNSGLAGQLANTPGVNTLGNSANSMGNFAQLLSLMASLRGAGTGVMNPLFWNSNQQTQSSLYPQFY